MSYYNDSNQHTKYEFSTQMKKSYLYQDPTQMWLSNYISMPTIYENIMLYHTTGAGKCHSENTPILMYDGTIKMVQDIKQGDYLMGDDSSPRQVLSLAKGTDMMYDIIPVKGEKYTVNEEHILCLKASGLPNLTDNIRNSVFQVRWIKDNKFNSKSFPYKNNDDKTNAKNIARAFLETINNEQILEVSVKEYLTFSKHRKSYLKGYRTGVNFPSKQVPFDPYILGYWLGDGTGIGSSITTNDSTVLHYMHSILPNYNLYLSKLQSEYSYGITGNGKLNGNVFFTTLKTLNLINNKHIPHIYKCNDRETRLKLLAGIIDADGYYGHGGYEICQSLKHEILIDDVVYLARSLGFACYKHKKRTSWTHNGIKKTGEAWRIIITGAGIEEVPTVIPRKKASPRKQIKNPLVTGIVVKKLKEDKYYGFTLDGNCRYLMGDFTVTHNTCAAITVAEGFKEYVYNMGRKVVVIVKNKNIQRNFSNELLSKCTKDSYLSDNERRLYFQISAKDSDDKKDLVNKVQRDINKYYSFITYGSFVNRVLGVKEFVKDELGRNTNKVVKDGGVIKRKSAKNSIDNFSNCVVIIDEAHNITNNDVYVALYGVLSKSYNCRVVLLTATPLYDNVKEILELSNILNVNNSKHILPIRGDSFKPISFGEHRGKEILTRVQSKFINNSVLKGGVIQMTNDGIDILKETLKGKVSYLAPNLNTFPKKIEMGSDLLNNTSKSSKVVYCQMSAYQYATYLNALKTDLNQYSKYDMSTAIGIIEAQENVLENTTISKSSSLYKNSSDAATMTYPNMLFGKEGFLQCTQRTKKGNITIQKDYVKVFTDDLKKYSIKLHELLTNLRKSKGNAFVYSNYVSYGGTSLIKLVLQNNGFKEYTTNSNNPDRNSFVVFDEGTKPDVREKYRRIFNSYENRNGDLISILIGSPLISEGITLKNVRQVHILEPSWNMSRINQIIGRAIRNMSHHDLDVSQRDVEVYKYVSIFYDENDMSSVVSGSQNLQKFFIDREKYILSEEKDRANKKVERLLKEISVDCNSTLKRNLISSDDFSAECDYQKCSYQCVEPQPTGEDKSTYDLYIKHFDQNDIQYSQSLIIELFSQYFVWHLDDLLSFIKSKEPSINDKAIFVALQEIVDNKLSAKDIYGRDGYIIQKGPYYIFNDNDIDVKSSLFSKMLDFTIDLNKLTLTEFMQQNGYFEEQKIEKQQKASVKKAPSLVKKDIDYNLNIIKSYLLFGTFRQRGTKDNMFGPIDNKFRIVDLRSNVSADDKRKTISGMWIGSFKKPLLIDIAIYLELKLTKDELQQLDKDQLARLIQEDLIKKKLVLK